MSIESGRVVKIVIGPEALPPALRQLSRYFLDTNIWIELAECRTDAARRARELLSVEVDAGRLVCPVYGPVLWELYAQEQSSARRVASLMDELSVGTAFGANEHVFQCELDAFVEARLAGTKPKSVRDQTLVPVASYLTTGRTLQFSEWWSEGDSERLASLVRTELPRVMVSDIIACRNLPVKFPHTPRLQECLEGRRVESRGSKRNAWFIEAKSVFTDEVQPRLRLALRQLAPQQALLLMLGSSELRADSKGRRLEALFEQLPALNARVATMTDSGFDPRIGDTMNHFVDCELLGVPLAYSDFMITEDGWIQGMLREGEFLRRVGGARLIPGVVDLAEHLERR